MDFLSRPGRALAHSLDTLNSGHLFPTRRRLCVPRPSVPNLSLLAICPNPNFHCSSMAHFSFSLRSCPQTCYQEKKSSSNSPIYTLEDAPCLRRRSGSLVVFLPGCFRSPGPHLPFLAQIFVETLPWAGHAGPHTVGITKTTRCKLRPHLASDGSAEVRHVQKDPKPKVSGRLETNSG